MQTSSITTSKKHNRDILTGLVTAWLGMLGLYFFVTTIIGTIQLYSPIPFSDQWGGYVGFMHRLAEGQTSAWWAQHMEHRIVVARGLFWLDAKLFGARNVFLLTAGMMLQGLTVLVLVWQTRRNNSPLPPVAVAGLAMCFLFSWIQQENFTWGFQSQFFCVYLFSLSAFAMHPPERHWLVSVALAVLATLSMGNGVFVFGVLILQSFLLRQSKPDVVVPLVAGLIMAAIYFYGFHKPDVVFPHVPLIKAVFRIPAFIVLFMGSPVFARGAGLFPAMAVGTVLIALVLWLAFRLYRAEQMTRYRAFLIASYAFVLVSGCGAAAGRYRLGFGQAVVSRYDTPVLISWACLALLLIDITTSEARRKIVLVGVAVVATWLMPFQMNAWHDTQMQFDRNLDVLSLKLGIDDPDIAGAIYPVASRPALRVDARWADDTEFGPFGYGWLHDAGLVRFSPDKVDPKICFGYMDTVVTKPGVTTATGWVVTARQRKSPVLILLVDAAGQTVGYGVSGSIRYDVQKATHSNLNVGWTALSRSRPAAAYAYELHRFCPLSFTP